MYLRKIKIVVFFFKHMLHGVDVQADFVMLGLCGLLNVSWANLIMWITQHVKGHTSSPSPTQSCHDVPGLTQE